MGRSMKKLNLMHGQTHSEPDDEGMVTVSGKCVILDENYSVKVNYEHLQFWLNGILIQKAMPEVSAADREFLISGSSPKGCDKLMEDLYDGDEQEKWPGR
jgi:hypothetical protein